MQPSIIAEVSVETGVVLALVAGYLIGSIPVADLVARRHAAVDLREVGDRNPGYWNAKETLGRRAAIPVFVGDAAKGAVAAALGLAVAAPGDWWIGYLAAGAAMIGHAWPVFAGFRGGRSVLTWAGAACVLSPLTAAIAIALLLVVTAVTRSFAWGARVGVFSYPIVQLAVDGPYRTAATGALMCIIGLRFGMAAWHDRRTATVGQE
jgi:acyl phosphate:glycerol-3-phosphate acyltransferase